MAQTFLPVTGAVQLVSGTEYGVKWRYPLPLPRAPSCFFSCLLFFAPSTLSECLEQIISPESVTSVTLSPPHPPIPRDNHFSQLDGEKRSSMGSSASAFLPTRVTAPAFLTEFAIEWTRLGLVARLSNCHYCRYHVNVDC